MPTDEVDAAVEWAQELDEGLGVDWRIVEPMPHDVFEGEPALMLEVVTLTKAVNEFGYGVLTLGWHELEALLVEG